MDQTTFDRIARALGGAASRRAGFRTALGALLGGGWLSGADAGSEGGKGRPGAERGRGGSRGAADAKHQERRERSGGTNGPAAQGPCKSTRRKDNTCTRDDQCCSKFCDMGKGLSNKDKRGRCRCKNRDMECQLDINCCKRAGQQMSCIQGICSERIPIGLHCKTNGWDCEDSRATCTTYLGNIPRGTFCLYGLNQQCRNDVECASGLCQNGACKLDLAEACSTAGASACGDRRATCTSYRYGLTSGSYCLLPDGAECRSHDECSSRYCDGEVCIAGIPTTLSCSRSYGSTPCSDRDAACTTYISAVPSGSYCLFGLNTQCTTDAECTTGNCQFGMCKYDLAQDCGTVGANTCGDRRASCREYRYGNVSGAYCLLPDSATCTDNDQCSSNYCDNGTCIPGIPTTLPCTDEAGSTPCSDPAAACLGYVEDDPAGSFCLFDVNLQCRYDAECTTGNCQNGVCKHDLAQACDGQDGDTCGDRRASCTTYRFGLPGGYYCLLPDDAACTANAVCESRACVNGVCIPGVPNGEVCTNQDFCADPGASCTSYTDPLNGQGTFCLLPDDYGCEDDLDCENGYCSAGICQTCTLGSTGSSCDFDSDCCSGFCSVVNGSGRCIGKKTIWALLTWNTDPYDGNGDLDTWVWYPNSAPQESVDKFGSIFPNGGDVVMYQSAWYPKDSIADPELEVPDAWLDVDDTNTPGSERFLWFRPIPNGTYRYAVKNYNVCPGDDGSTSACGSSWNKIDTNWTPFTNPSYDAQVVFYEYSNQIRKFVLPWGTYGTDGNVNHYYWWQVTDLAFDANGWFAGFTTLNNSSNGVIRNCAPAPYPGNAEGESSNICPYPN